MNESIVLKKLESTAKVITPAAGCKSRQRIRPEGQEVIFVKKDETELLQYFENLEQTLSELDQVVEWLKSEDQKMTDKFKDDEDYKYFRSPFSAFAGYEFEKTILGVKQDCCNLVVREMDKLYNNITFDADKIWARFRETGFFPTAAHSYIHNLCVDEDKIALEQIKDFCIELLPFGNFGIGNSHCKANKPEHIQNKNNLQLYEYVYYDKLYHGTKRIRALINFTWITLRCVSPAGVEPQGEILNETGIVMYQDDLIKSIRVYKNSNLKVRFHNPDHADIMSKALTDLVEVVNQIG